MLEMQRSCHSYAPHNYWIYAQIHMFHTQSAVHNNVHERGDERNLATGVLS